MSVVNAKCPNCGASIQLDNERTEGFCSYCGSKVKVEEAQKLLIQGTVKVDTSDELANLYQIARRAKDANNSESAYKYYDMILVKDPNSWEATFYVTYYQAMQCKIGEIHSAAYSIVNCEEAVLELIKSNVDKDNQNNTLIGIYVDLMTISTMLFNAAKQHYYDIDFQIRADYLQEYIYNAAAAAEIMYSFGNLVIVKFGEECGSTAALSCSSNSLFYRIETENLLDIDGVEPGDTITSIVIMPNGVSARTYGRFYLSKLYVNKYDTDEEFAAACPQDVSETIHVDENTLRQIAVDEALRTANTEWTTEETFSTAYGNKNNPTVVPYEAGKTYRGPVYQRTSDSTRERFQSRLADNAGVYNANDMKDDFNDKYYFPYGMDCQAFVINAISRVSRTNAWAVENTPGSTRTKLLGELTVDPYPAPAYTDRDIVAKNTAQAVYKNYAAAKPGDIAIHNMVNGVVHTRLVKSVDVDMLDEDPTEIDGDKSSITFVEQVGGSTKSFENATYHSSSRTESKVTFRQLREGYYTSTGSWVYGNYIVYTLDEYKDEQVEDVKVEAVAASQESGKHFSEGGLFLSVSSNYRIISYRVTLEKLGSDNLLYDSVLVYTSDSHVMGVNYANATLDAIIAEQVANGNGTYRVNMIVDSGPVTTLEQEGTVPQTTKSFDFTVGEPPVEEPPVEDPHNKHSADSGWIALNDLTYSAATPVELEDGTLYYIRKSFTISDDADNGKAGGDCDDYSAYMIVPDGATVTICLNGCTLTSEYNYTDAARTQALIMVYGTLNLCDCSEHTETVDEVTTTVWDGALIHNSASGSGASTILVESNEGSNSDIDARFNFYGGNISGNLNVRHGAVRVRRGIFNLYDGKISGNKATKVSTGAGVGVTGSGQLKMYGGEISDNTAQISSSSGNGGGIYVDASKVTYIYGGTIKENTAASWGGGMYIAGGDVRMSGGVVSGNKAAKGGGVYSAKPFTLSGSGQFLNNVGSTGGGELWFKGTSSSTAKFTFSGGSITTTGNVKKGGCIYFESYVTGTMSGDASIEHTGCGSSTKVNGPTVCLNGSTCNFTINGGTITNDYSGSGTGKLIYNAGTCVVNGGSFNSGATPCIHAYNGSTYIYGGTFNKGVGVSSGTSHKLEVYGGTFNSTAFPSATISSGRLSLYGGVFSSVPETYYDLVKAEDVDFVEREDGKFELKYNGKTFTGSNMELGEKLNMNLYFRSDVVHGHYAYDSTQKATKWVNDAPVAKITYAGASEPVTGTVTLTDGDGYMVDVDGIAAMNMADKITVDLYDADGNLIESVTESVRDYAARVLDDEDKADAHRLMADMLAYGAAAQKYFGYNTEDLADSVLADFDVEVSDPDAAIEAAKSGNDSDFAYSRAYHSANLTLENDVDFNLYFWIGQLADTNYTISLNDGAAEPGTFEQCLDATAEDGVPLLYKVKVPGLKYADLVNTQVSITFTQTDGERTITDSVVKYLVRNDGKARDSFEGADSSALYGSVLAFANSCVEYAN